MKKTYRIEVDCANCANRMETAVGKIAGVASVSVNFMTQKMTVTLEEGYDPHSMMATIKIVCRKIEPDFEIELS